MICTATTLNVLTLARQPEPATLQHAGRDPLSGRALEEPFRQGMGFYNGAMME